MVMQSDIIEYKAKGAGDETLDKAINYSVVVNENPYLSTSFLANTGYNQTLPNLHDPGRQNYLSRLRMHPDNSMFQGAVSGLTKQVTTAAYELKGKRRVKYYQEVLINADRGRGWDSLIQKTIWDYSTLDDGAVWELIGAGNIEQPLTRELIVGVGYLDPRQCSFTNNFEYPLIYQDDYGKLHKMHRTRVIRFVDMPQPDPLLCGRGLSGLSRSLAYVRQAIVNLIYQGERLSNQPPVGILNVGNIPQYTEFRNMYKTYMQKLRSETAGLYKELLIWAQAGEPGSIEFVGFSDAPVGYNPVEFLEMEANGIANGLNIDVQDILPIKGGSLGVNGQSKILDKKAQGKGLAQIFKMLERAINRFILPDSLEFTFKERDLQNEKTETETTVLLLQAAAQLETLTDRETAQQFLIAMNESLRDVMTDESGAIRLFDTDPVEKDTPPVLNQFNAPATPSPDTDNRVLGDALTAGQSTNTDQPDVLGSERAMQGVKDYDDIQGDIRKDFYSIIQFANENPDNRRMTGIRARALISKYGRRLQLQGLVDGGVDVETLTGDDLEAYNRLIRANSGYVGNLTDNIKSGGGGWSETNIRSHVEMWLNKTFDAFYMEGLLSADRNGLYKFGGKDGLKPCDTCKGLKGNAHRLKDWFRKRLVPRIHGENYKCGAWHCQHKLEKTTGKPRGSWV